MSIAHISAMSKEGNKMLQEYLNSFTEEVDMKELAETMSEGMKKFLQLGRRGDDDGQGE